MRGCMKYVPQKGNAQVLGTKSALRASSMDYGSDSFEECLHLATIMISYSSCGFLNRTLYLVFKLMTPTYLPGFSFLKRVILHRTCDGYISMINLLGKSFLCFII